MTRPSIGLLTLLLTLSASAFGQLVDDPLHGFCWGGTPTCPEATVGGVKVTPTSTNPPNFGFTVSPGPQTGDYLIDVLVPNNENTVPSFTITGTQGGTSNTDAISATASLFSATAWTSGGLDTYLGMSASPANPIGAFLPATQSVDANAAGYFVYQADLGQTRLQDNPNPLAGPLLNIGPALPIGTVIVGFLNTSNNGVIATANSGALFESGPGTTGGTGGNGGGSSGGTVPEPGAIVLLGSALVALFSISRKKLVRS